MRGGSNIRYNANEIEYELFEIFGGDALFTDKRIDRESLPPGIYTYELRQGEDGDPATLEKQVLDNFYGTVLMNHPLTLGRYSCRKVGCDDFGFREKDVLSLEAFMKSHPPRQSGIEKGR